MKLEFEKYSAHGNDFIVIDNRVHHLLLDEVKLFQKLCKRRTSVGADGVILIDTDEPDFRAHFYNSDGNAMLMCGNGARIAVDFARHLGIITTQGTFRVRGKKHKGRIDGSLIGAELYTESRNITQHIIRYNDREYTGYVCDTGVPHYIIIAEDDTPNPTIELARKIRYNPEFNPDGVNVSWVQVIDQHTILIRTYERGVEDFTLSCGTAAAAVAFIGMQQAWLDFPVFVRSLGGTLRVDSGDSPDSIWIWGTVDHIYTGTIADINR